MILCKDYDTRMEIVGKPERRAAGRADMFKTSGKLVFFAR